MNVLLEQPLVIVFLGVIVVAILGVCLQQTGRGLFLYLIVGAVLLCAGLVGLERLIVTERESVKNTLYTMSDAIEDDDVETLLEHISPQSKDVRRDARFYMSKGNVEEIKIKSNLTITVRDRQNPPMAVAQFNAVIIGGDKGGILENQRGARFFVVTFRKEKDGQWRVRKYEHRAPLDNETE